MPEPYRARRWWLPLLIVAALPGLLVALAVAVIAPAYGDSRDAWAEGGFYVLVALAPFVLAAVTVALHRRRLRAGADLARSAARAKQRPLWIVAPSLSACLVIGMLMVYSEVERGIDNATRPGDAADDSCRNQNRLSSTLTPTTYVVVFDRRCGTKRTVNVSIAPGQNVEGPGNVFVAENVTVPGSPDGLLSVVALPHGPSQVLVSYSSSAHVIERRERWGRIKIDFVTDSILH